MIKGIGIKGIVCFLSCLMMLTASAQQTMSLSGKWQVRLGTGKVQPIALPGTLDGAGIGTPNTLQPALQKPQLGAVYAERCIQARHAAIGAGCAQPDSGEIV